MTFPSNSIVREPMETLIFVRAVLWKVSPTAVAWIQYHPCPYQARKSLQEILAYQPIPVPWGDCLALSRCSFLNALIFCGASSLALLLSSSLLTGSSSNLSKTLLWLSNSLLHAFPLLGTTALADSIVAPGFRIVLLGNCPGLCTWLSLETTCPNYFAISLTLFSTWTNLLLKLICASTSCPSNFSCLFVSWTYGTFCDFWYIPATLLKLGGGLSTLSVSL